MAHEYYLRVRKVTQSLAADGPAEDPVDPGHVDPARFLHVYVAGYVPDGTRMPSGKYRVVGAGQDYAMHVQPSPDGYRFTITHGYLQGGASYLLRFADDFAEPSCLSSQVIDVR
jgi:hypothetical protein